MTEQTATVSAEADSGTVAAENNTDDLDSQLEAMRLSEEQAQEPEPKSEPKAEAKEPEKADTEPKKDKKDPLPVEEIEKRWRDQQAATKAERSKRQERDAEIEALKEQVAALTGRPTQQEQNPLDIPDFDENPEAAIRAAIAFAKQNAQAQQQETQLSAKDRQFQETAQVFTRAEAEYAAAVPDYYDAVQFSQQARFNELTNVWGQSPQEAQETVRQESMEMVAYAMSGDGHPAHLIYNLAKSRGYTGPAPKVAETPTVEDMAKAAGADIAQRNKAQVMAKTLSGSGGSSVKGGPTVEQLNGTSGGDEFDKLFDEIARQERGY